MATRFPGIVVSILQPLVKQAVMGEAMIAKPRFPIPGLLVVLWMACGPVAIVPAVHAQSNAPPQNTLAQATPSPAVRGQKLGEMQAKFNNPDPIVQMIAYEEAFRSDDTTLRQMAFSSATTSSNASIRGMAVFSAISRMRSLVVTFEPPAELKSAQERQIKEKDAQFPRNLENSLKLLAALGGNLGIEIVEFDVQSGTFSFVESDTNHRSNLEQKKFRKGSVVGETVQFTGNWFMLGFEVSCPVSMKLNASQLTGLISCSGGPYSLPRTKAWSNLF